MTSKLFRDLREVEYDCDGKVNHQGDPIFIVDLVTLTIKTCIAKVIHELDYSKFMLIDYCEKGKYSNWTLYTKGVRNLPPSDWHSIIVNKNSSTSSLASTTLMGAMKILNLHKSKGSFSSLLDGDSVYCFETRKKKIHEFKIESVKSSVTCGKSLGVHTLNFGENGSLRLRGSYYESKASMYSDDYFTYISHNHHIYGVTYFFVKKEDAEALLNKKIKEEEKKNQLQQIGTDTKLNDAKGNRLHIGDSVAYVNGVGTHISLSTAKVIKATKAYITVLDEDKREENIRHAKEALDNWVKNGNKPYELNFTYYGVYTITTNKILLLNKYNQK
jgi:uncharacterized Zn ribbon protein